MNAARYPIGKVWYEAEIVRDRLTARQSTEAVLTYSAFGAVVNGALSKKGASKSHKEFKKILKDLRNGN